jgi:RimJ/RimL family protein N-acetyltransferase
MMALPREVQSRGFPEALHADGTVAIRRFRLADRPLLVGAVHESLEELTSWMTWCSEEYGHEHAMSFLDQEPQRWQTGERYDFAIYDRNLGTFLGSIGLSQLNWSHRVANVGYWVRSKKTGQGVGRAAIRLIARFGFEELGLNRLEFVIQVGNVASMRAALKAGARNEGVLRQRIPVGETADDALLLSLLPTDLIDEGADLT